MLKKIIIIILSLCMNACIPAAFVAGAAAGGAVVGSNRSIKTIVTDKDISHEAQVRIYNHPQLQHRVHISVITYNRIVLMVGQAPTSELRNKAFQIVQSVPKVRRVYNEVTIASPISVKQRTNDTWITTKVKAEMVAKPGLRSEQIKVLTEDGVVYLMGLTTKTQGNLAADVARRVKGVKRVVKLLEYVH